MPTINKEEKVDYKERAKRIFEQRQRRITNYHPDKDDSTPSILKYLRKNINKEKSR